MATFEKEFHALKEVVCCAITVPLCMYIMVGRSIASIDIQPQLYSYLGALCLSKYVVLGCIYWLYIGFWAIPGYTPPYRTICIT